MRNVSDESSRRPTARGILTLVMHQFIATWGLAVAARLLTDLVIASLRFWRLPVHVGPLYTLLTGPPYFPVQIAAGLTAGCFLSRRLRHKAMLWVWVLPLMLLCYAFVALPTLTPHITPTILQSGRGQSRLSHYFGTGCRPENLCFDQVLITLSFYTAAAYSIVALLAHKMPKKLAPDDRPPATQAERTQSEPRF